LGCRDDSTEKFFIFFQCVQIEQISQTNYSGNVLEEYVQNMNSIQNKKNIKVLSTILFPFRSIQSADLNTLEIITRDFFV